jgi:hypothetical protein
LLVCLNVAAALVASRLTAMRHIEVFGAKPYDQPRIAAILANMRGVPRARLNSERIESDVMQEPSVREAKLAANWFGQGSLSVLYRKPVAKLAGLSTLALDEQGVVYSAPDLPAGLTEIQFPGGAPPTLVGLAGDWPAGYLAKLAGDVRTLGATGNVSIQVDADGAICLNVGAGRVKLGSCDILDHKLEVLRQRLRANPNELSQIEELVLTNPDRPAIVKKKQVSRQ